LERQQPQRVHLDAGQRNAVPDAPWGTGASYADAINHAGNIIAGVSGVGLRPTKWIDGVPTELTPSYPNSSFTPYGLSDDGSVVAGYVQNSVGPSFAGVWTPATGIVRLSDYLTANGVVIPAGLTLGQCHAVSADGKTFGGTIDNGPFGIQGYVATVPAPGALSLLGFAGLLAARRRR
jgi:uncharacterized membrane protein